MFCASCGQDLPDNAYFCLKCGRPQRLGSGSRMPASTRFETCEIEYEVLTQAGFLRKRQAVYWAKAIGPGGQYSAAQSAVFEDMFGTDGQRALQELIATLTADGWDYVGKEALGPHRFRRAVK